MPGDDWQRFANLRLLYSYMYAQPGKKLLFMGCEFAQFREWAHDSSLDWHLLDLPLNRGMKSFMQQLNRLYRDEAGMHALDCDANGFEWVDCNDSQAGVVSLLRKSRNPADTMLVVCNFTPIPRMGYRIGVPRPGFWCELLNSDAKEYGGGGMGNFGGLDAEEISVHGRPFSVNLTLPPLACVFLKAAS
jgi:1,4-alpha-glucan branching enzyme